MRSDIYGRRPIATSRNPFTCGITGKTFTTAESHERSDLIAKALSKIMGWEPNADSPWDKVVGIFSLNTVSFDQGKGRLMAGLCWLTIAYRLTTSLCCLPSTVSLASQPLRMSRTAPVN